MGLWLIGADVLAGGRFAISPLDETIAVLAALTKRVRAGFDPQGVLNAGRMWAGV